MDKITKLQMLLNRAACTVLRSEYKMNVGVVDEQISRLDIC